MGHGYPRINVRLPPCVHRFRSRVNGYLYCGNPERSFCGRPLDHNPYCAFTAGGSPKRSAFKCPRGQHRLDELWLMDED